MYQGAYSNIFLFVGLVSLSVFLSFYPSISIALPSHLGCRLLLRNEASVCVRYAFFLLFQVSVTSSRLFQWGNVKENQSLPPSSTSFYSLSWSVPALLHSTFPCWLQSKYTPRRQPVCAGSSWLHNMLIFLTRQCIVNIAQLSLDWFSWREKKKKMQNFFSALQLSRIPGSWDFLYRTRNNWSVEQWASDL